MRRLIIGAVLTAALGSFITGCGSSDDKKDPPEVAWAAKVCESVNKAGGQQLSLPTQSKDPKQYKANIETFLDQISKRLGDMEAGVKSAGNPPVNGADKAVSRALTRLEITRKSVENAKANLAKADTSSMAALQKDMKDLSKTMIASMAYKGPKDDLRADPALTKAFDAAPSCKVNKA
ncbi:hypothetical protein [Actinomadura atramentaria]|uniref:hypothetical protein n=1 Tax=Actinomadura atramentaria TaxID=1990 RepID=UPI0003689AED|nr:hypothetical protein [Actinomadura atramentaria]